MNAERYVQLLHVLGLALREKLVDAPNVKLSLEELALQYGGRGEVTKDEIKLVRSKSIDEMIGEIDPESDG